MAANFLFELVSPERLLLSEEVSEVQLPGSEGYLTVLANHSPMMTTIIPGLVTVKGQQGDQSFVVFGGFADISANGCSLLAESAIPVGEFEREELTTRIAEARATFEAAKNDEQRSKAEEYMNQLIVLEGVLTSA